LEWIIADLFSEKIIRNAPLLMIIWEKSLAMDHCRFAFGKNHEKCSIAHDYFGKIISNGPSLIFFLKSKSAMEHFS
jgi:hypothetical protein